MRNVPKRNYSVGYVAPRPSRAERKQAASSWGRPERPRQTSRAAIGRGVSALRVRSSYRREEISIRPNACHTLMARTQAETGGTEADTQPT